MSVFVLHPDNQGKFLSQPLQSNQESNRAELDRTQLTAQVRSLHETIATLRTDLARIKDARTQQATQPATTEMHDAKPAELAFAEGTNPLTTSALPGTNRPEPADAAEQSPAVGGSESPPGAALAQIAAPANPVAAPLQPRRRGNFATTPLKAGDLPPLPKLDGPQLMGQRSASIAPPSVSPARTASSPLNPILLNSPVAALRANQIRTGSLPQAAEPAAPAPVQPAATAEPKPVVFGKPTVKPRRVAPTAALSLSSAASITGLRASWLLLTTRHREAFMGYEPRYVADPGTGNYRLLAGPIVSRAEADRVCTELRAQSINCGVTVFAGAPL